LKLKSIFNYLKILNASAAVNGGWESQEMVLADSIGEEGKRMLARFTERGSERSTAEID